MAPTVVVSRRQSIFTHMAVALGHIRALGTVVLIAAAISLSAEAGARAPKPHATAQVLRPGKSLDEGLTSKEPPLPAQRPAAPPAGPPSPANQPATLSEGLTSTEPPPPAVRPA